jgi:hypothetical protein
VSVKFDGAFTTLIEPRKIASEPLKSDHFPQKA